MLQHYIITYDLRSHDMDYTKLMTKIKSFSSWVHPLERVWGIYTEENTEDIFVSLQKFINTSTDRLLIIKLSEINHEAIQGWLGSNFWTWLAKTNLEK